MELIADGGCMSPHVDLNWLLARNHALLVVAGVGSRPPVNRAIFHPLATRIGGFGAGYLYHSPIGPFRILVGCPIDRPDWVLNLVLGQLS